MVSTLDLGICKVMRPPYKKVMADRLARLALYNSYGYKNCATATLFNSDGLPAESFFLIDKLEN